MDSRELRERGKIYYEITHEKTVQFKKKPKSDIYSQYQMTVGSQKKTIHIIHKLKELLWFPSR